MGVVASGSHGAALAGAALHGGGVDKVRRQTHGLGLLLGTPAPCPKQVEGMELLPWPRSVFQPGQGAGPQGEEKEQEVGPQFQCQWPPSSTHVSVFLRGAPNFPN